MGGWVYIMASRKGGTLYTGVTNNIARRTFEHRDSVLPGFTARYGVIRLVWYRRFDSIVQAIEEEKRIKKWRRGWKIELIKRENPEWKDLYPLLF
ncbi:MAG: GIY-YIG nuclease family protein [Pseudomonadota bacterium]